MGRQARLKAARQGGITITEAEARQLLEAQTRCLTIRVNGETLLKQVQVDLAAATQAHDETLRAIAKKYHLDLAGGKAYTLKGLMLMPIALSARPT